MNDTPYVSRVTLFVSILVIIVATIMLTGFDKKPSLVPAVSPDPRVEWQQYPVEGLLLCNPNLRDETGRPRCALLPPGSILLIPTIRDSTRGSN